LPHAFRCKDGLNEKFKAARPFYSVIIVLSVISIALDFADVSPMKALYWAAIVSGVLAPFLLIGILIVAWIGISCGGRVVCSHG
jgi:Mn2+/Fe2+ NRAMP family transporter